MKNVHATSSTSRARRRGAVMMEFIFVLPLLLVVLMLLFYFGRGFARVQHAQAMTHYEAWRQASPVRDVLDDSSVLPAPDGNGNEVMNQAFLGGNAATVGFGVSGEFPDDAMRGLATVAAPYDNDAADLVHWMADRDAGYRPTAKVTHEETRRLWSWFNGPMRMRQVLFGGDWAFVRGWRVDQRQPPDRQWSYDPYRHGSPSVMTAVRDRYLSFLDQRLESVPMVANQRNPLAAQVRSLYLGEPAYRGPQVTPD